MTVPMIDVSSLQHPNGKPINWCEVVQSGIRAVMVKATEGVNYVNPWMERDAHGARAAGLAIGYYHFSHPSHSSAEAQVAYFSAAIKSCPTPTLGLAHDLEVTEGFDWSELQGWGEAFTEHLLEHTSNPINYTNLNFHNHMPMLYRGHRMWLAEPSGRPRLHCWAWQEAPRIVAGVPDLVDYSTLYEPLP